MKKKMGYLMLVTASFLLVTAVAYAQENKETKRPGRSGQPRQEETIFEQLNLTPEQKQRLEDNRQAQRQQAQEVIATLKDKRRNLQKILKNPSATRSSVREIVDDIKALQSKQTDLRLDGIFSVKEILTTEQYVKFQGLMEKQAEKMRRKFKQCKNCDKSR